MIYLKDNMEIIKEILYILILFSIVLWISLNLSDGIHLSKNEWKCTQADIIDNDPSNTKCTVYKKIKLEEKE